MSDKPSELASTGAHVRLSIAAPPSLTWNPRPDITAWELTNCLPLLLNGLSHKRLADLTAACGEAVMRHWKTIS